MIPDLWSLTSLTFPIAHMVRNIFAKPLSKEGNESGVIGHDTPLFGPPSYKAFNHTIVSLQPNHIPSSSAWDKLVVGILSPICRRNLAASSGHSLCWIGFIWTKGNEGCELNADSPYEPLSCWRSPATQLRILKLCSDLPGRADNLWIDSYMCALNLQNLPEVTWGYPKETWWICWWSHRL